MYGLDAWTVGGLLLAAMAAGWVDAVVGGGGLIQLPSLLIALPNQPVATSLGTNKVSSIFGTSAAAATYWRRARPDPGTVIPMAATAFVGALCGSTVATHLPASLFKPVIVVLLIAVWFWTLLSPSLGSVDNHRWSGKKHIVAVVIAGGVIGFYDGAVGPGTGTFLVFVLVSAMGLSFLRASATAKIVNLATNIASIIIFGFAGVILWGLGLLMGAANIVGGIIGARTAIKRGSGFVRIVFLTVVAALIVRLVLS